MKKNFTLLTSALLLGASLSVSAEVNNTEWKEGNYFYLKAGNSYLSLDKAVKDSVIVTSNLGDTKFEKDLALWQITSKSTSIGPAYQFKNKATKAILAFSKKVDATTKLDPTGVVDWIFKDGKISGYYDSGKSYNLSVNSSELIISDENSASFEVLDPESYNLKITELGDGLSTFYVKIAGQYEENIFDGKELVATEVEDKEYFRLQYKEDSEFKNGTPKYLGVDTIRIENNIDQKSYGLKFKADSTYKKDDTHSYTNEEVQKFKFSIDLKNDSIALFVKKSPVDPGEELQVVYASLDNKKVLTVSNVNDLKGTAPLIKTLRGVPVRLSEGDGVYFLKNAGNGKNGGKYLYNLYNSNATYSKDKPSVNKADGQWLVKENNGVYTIVDRLKGSVYAENKEIFAVKGIKNAFTVAGLGDTLSFDIQKVDLNNKFLGTLHFSNAEMKEKTIKLSLGSFGYFVPVTVTDSLLVPEREGTAAEFRLVAKDIEAVGGAKALNDTLFATSYVLTDWSGNKFLAEDKDKKSFIMTTTQPEGKLDFVFEWAESDGVYQLKADKGYASYEDGLKLGEKPSTFQVDIVDAPSYVKVDKEFIRLESNGKYLTMNPYTLFAEMKNEGQPITKAGYLASHFAMKIEKADTIIPGKPVYLISTCKIGEKDGVLSDRYYLAPIKDKEYNGETRLGFIPATEELKTSKDSPAFFAFKITEDGSVLIENIKDSKFATQRENTMVLGENTGMSFSLIETSDPTPNEVIESVKPVSVVAVGGHGSVTVMNAKDKKIVITDILGKIVGNYRVTNDRFTVPVSRGLVIVAIEGEVAQKVIVK